MSKSWYWNYCVWFIVFQWIMTKERLWHDWWRSDRAIKRPVTNCPVRKKNRTDIHCMHNLCMFYGLRVATVREISKSFIAYMHAAWVQTRVNSNEKAQHIHSKYKHCLLMIARVISRGLRYHTYSRHGTDRSVLFWPPCIVRAVPCGAVWGCGVVWDRVGQCGGVRGSVGLCGVVLGRVELCWDVWCVMGPCDAVLGCRERLCGAEKLCLCHS